MRRGVAIGQIDLGIDVRRLSLQPPSKHQVVLGRWAVDEDPNLAADPRSLGFLDDPPLQSHHA